MYESDCPVTCTKQDVASEKQKERALDGRRELETRFLIELGPVRGSLLAFCRSLLYDRQEFEDALQIVLATAWKKFPDFCPGTSFRSWVFRIATLEIWNMNRKSSRERERFAPLDQEPADLTRELETGSVYDRLIRDPESVFPLLDLRVADALRALPATERAVLLLRTVADLTTKETAEMLEMPVGSVMGYLGRARSKLRMALAEYAVAEGIIPKVGGRNEP